MPILSRETIGVPSLYGFTRFIKILKYDTKNKEFSIELPEWVKEGLNKSKASGSTQVEAERNFKDLCQQYESSIKNVRKVIAYKIEMTGEVMEGEGEDRRCVKKWEDHHFTQGIILGISYAVLNETTVGKNKSYREINGSRFDVRHSHKIIPWSETSEAFFHRTEQGMLTLMLKIDEFFSGDESNVVKRIESVKNLLTFKEDK
jgi:hypothetical protein